MTLVKEAGIVFGICLFLATCIIAFSIWSAANPAKPVPDKVVHRVVSPHYGLLNCRVMEGYACGYTLSGCEEPFAHQKFVCMGDLMFPDGNKE